MIETIKCIICQQDIVVIECSRCNRNSCDLCEDISIEVKDSAICGTCIRKKPYELIKAIELI